MVNTNKILTVSYGTFSCTLEGFDDSFGTMKAIAEYFRDLASDDRYFGAEPPTPDAEMLARIAEREIERRVEAHFEQDKIVLRADPGSVLPAAAQAEAMTEQDDAPDTSDGRDDVAEHVTAQDSEQDHAEEQAEPQTPDAPAEIPAVSESAEAEEADVAISHEATEDIAQEQSAEAPGEVAAEDRPADLPSIASLHVQEEDTDEDRPFPTASNQVESVAAKLQRIRAVASQAETTATPAAAYSEDEHAEDFLTETHEDIEAAMEIDDSIEIGRPELDADGTEDDTSDTDESITALMARFDSPDEDDTDKFDLFDETEDEALAFDADDETTEPDQPAVEETSEDLSDEIETATAPDSVTEPEEPVASDAEPLRARVIKMKRADFEAAIAEGNLEEDDAADIETEETKDTESTLSPEDEADLLRELAAVEAELATDDSAPDDLDEQDDSLDDHSTLIDEYDDTDDDFDDDETGEESTNFFADHPEDMPDGRSETDESDRATPFAGSDAESEMGRIFKETDAHLNEETGRGRRNAIAHLRAAVEANKAEIGAGGDLAGTGPDTEAYRDDLASVVRPRRPQAPDQGDRSRRPETARPAPLKLVAEQRVDLDDAQSTPVRPRRVQVSTPAQSDTAAASSDFADYAETVGANSLPELLEAAAAYLSFVEGREQFSRPQLMTHVRQVEKDDFSREDGLRTFGQLLREGKIVKLKGGRFTASDNISYRPGARYAGE